MLPWYLARQGSNYFFFRKCFQGKTYAAKCHILLLELYLFIMLSELEVNQGAKIAFFFSIFISDRMKAL